MKNGMTPYVAPLEALAFAVATATNGNPRLAVKEDLDWETFQGILAANARLTEDILLPLSRHSDTTHPVLHADGKVTTSEAARSAYKQFIDGGWPGAPLPVELGGLGLMRLAWAPLAEMWNAANPAFALCPVGNVGAVDALLASASATIIERYASKMVTGTWPGTMNITEPQAGSDLSLIRARAIPDPSRGPGHYRISGQKIFITFGEHDLAENIVHLVLARLPDAPAGVKGLSLFLVPKFLVGGSGEIGERNDVRCVALENKLGIHGSPTAVMVYGEMGGAQGFLIGEENQGLNAMFVMMNLARFSLGLQGTGIAERASQAAFSYAATRIQGRHKASGGKAVAIIHHPGVRRALLNLLANTHAARNLTYYSASLIDALGSPASTAERQEAQRLLGFLTPIVKGWISEMAVDSTNAALQIFGGAGYIEDTGVAQLVRDARITTIYEGTTTIQANDLVHRKVIGDGGAAFALMARKVMDTASRLQASPAPRLCRAGAQLAAALSQVTAATDWIVRQGEDRNESALAVAEAYLEACGRLFGGWRLLHAALLAQSGTAAFRCPPSLADELEACSSYFADWQLSQVEGLSSAVMRAGASVTDADSLFEEAVRRLGPAA
ncbi:acyl-CoA dehydrogenase [Cupriavidus sp. USMAHM13]|uniref:acyl-CoA dehydrogenase n=1 Tax=Cupriavidus sp. USMAHM13 TaxID=1389192 RepID=UPI0009F53A73|nr:acyl-CoA dehydrogenase [Cupriavidus sp. USMAHM13]